MPVATMTSKGQITVPASIRQAYGLEAGSRMDFVAVDPDTIMVRTRVRTLKDLCGSIPSNGIHLAIEDMDDAIAEAIWAEAGLQ